MKPHMKRTCQQNQQSCKAYNNLQNNLVEYNILGLYNDFLSISHESSFALHGCCLTINDLQIIKITSCFVSHPRPINQYLAVIYCFIFLSELERFTLLIAITTASFSLRAGANCMRVFQAFSSSPPQSSMKGATVENIRLLSYLNQPQILHNE